MAGDRVARSKAGCISCKQRKVRCGEQRPTCVACDRLNLNCEYLERKRQPSSQPRTPKQQRDGRSRYAVRFVDCNQITRHQAHKYSDVKNGASGREYETRKQSSTPAVSSPQEQIPAHSSATEPAESEDRPIELSSIIEPWNTGFSSLISDTQSYTDQIITQQSNIATIEPDARHFFNDLDYTLTSDISTQIFDMLDQNPWFNSVLNADLACNYHGTEAFTEVQFEAPLEGASPLPNQHLIIAEKSPQTSVASEETSVQILQDDHSLIQHFLTSMRQYSTKLVKSSEEDVNCFMFSHLGLFNAQLFDAMMAFAALHRAQTQDNFFSQAELRYQRATALLYEDEHAHHHLDVTISTVWFLLQYELLFAKGTTRFCNLLAHLSHVLDGYPNQGSADHKGLSKISARTLISISTYDVRAMVSGGSGGYMVRSLTNFLPLRKFLKEPPSTWAGGPLAPLSLSIPPSSNLDHLAVLRLRLRCNLTHGRILMLSPPSKDSGEESMAGDDDQEWITIKNSLLEQYEVFSRGTDTVEGFPVHIATGKMFNLPGKLSSLQCTVLLSLSALYAAYIDYHKALCLWNATWSFDTDAIIPSNNECSARMVRIAWFVNQNRPLSPQSVWPSLLWVAGVYSSDGIHRTWVLNALKETETWSTHFLQTRVLLEAVYKYQSSLQPGEAFDVVKLQAQTTGPFVI